MTDYSHEKRLCDSTVIEGKARRHIVKPSRTTMRRRTAGGESAITNDGWVKTRRTVRRTYEERMRKAKARETERASRCLRSRRQRERLRYANGETGETLRRYETRHGESRDVVKTHDLHSRGEQTWKDRERLMERRKEGPRRGEEGGEGRRDHGW